MKQNNDKYGVKSLKRDFPTDEVCLSFIFDALHSRQCSCGGNYKPIKGRRQFQCSKCRFQIAPTAGTIFHKSDTPLTLWFHALLVFSNAKSGVSAKELQRQLEVTYKCAWRMLKLIRQSLTQKGTKLAGKVEMDETYIGGRFPSGRYNEQQREAIAAKTPVIGAVERKGRARVQMATNLKAWTLGQFLAENVELKGTELLTDESNRYRRVTRGYDRHKIKHGKQEYVRGDVHTNTVEGLWSHIKRSITGTHKAVSKKHLQSYLNGFVFHWNNRHSDSQRFSALLGALLPV